MKIDIPKRALNFLSWETASNLKNNNNLINKNLRHNENEQESNNEYPWKLEVTINVFRAMENISKLQYLPKHWIKLTPQRKLY